MNKRIIYRQENGSVAILVPSLETDLKRLEDDVPEGVEYEIVDVKDIPSDRSFRNAWVQDTTESSMKIGVKLDRAVGISLERVRNARDDLFVELDKQYMIAQREGSDTGELDDKRQKLKAATDKLKSLDTNNDGYLSVEEVANQLLPLEEFEV